MAVNHPVWLVIPREPKHAKSMQSCHYIVRTMSGWTSAKKTTTTKNRKKSDAYWMELCLICTNPLEFQLLCMHLVRSSPLKFQSTFAFLESSPANLWQLCALAHWSIFSSCWHFLKTSMAINKSYHSVNHFPAGESFLTFNKSFPGSG